MKKINLILALLFLLLLPAVKADDINIGIYVLNLGKFDIATGGFTADFYLSMTCADTVCDLGNFEFMNGRASSIDKIIDKPDEKFYRIQANLNSDINLRQFPFDNQQMQIILEDKEKTTDEIVYVPNIDESGIDDSIAFTGWRMDGWHTNVTEHYYKVYDETYSQYIFTIDISRIAFNSFMKTFLPVIFIILIGISSFYLDPDKMPNRLAMAGSSLVGSVMFHISIANQIPPVGYLTFADKFMIMTYFILLATFILNIVILELIEKGKKDLAYKIHKDSKYSAVFAIFILYLLLVLFI